MHDNKSLDLYKQIIATLLSDVQTLHNSVFTPRALRLTLEKVNSRIAREGLSFLSKTLPRLGKAFDKALLGEVPLDSTGWCLMHYPGSKLPKFLGELFQCIFSHDGMVLPFPCVTCIKHVRQILYAFYKLKLPYSPDDEASVISQFVKTEDDLTSYNDILGKIADYIDSNGIGYLDQLDPDIRSVIRKARIKLSRVFSGFDPKDIRPRHGPGAVSTKEQLWGKYSFTRINPRIERTYPFDAYFTASLGHICDSYKEFQFLKEEDLPARVILVPKDSRGPRLISCEPLEFQWIQQGLGDAIVRRVESHPLTRYNIHFTDQQPNQIAALYGSKNGKYATLDLKEASDRVTVGLVRLLFPEPLREALLNSRSQSTRLPNGTILPLKKFAPMGSALCFPILALTIWAIVSSSESDADARKSILVYGDDVVVKTERSAHATKWLEAFGLIVNRDKSCTSGFFRESCGMDAYRGVCVTPVRFRTTWANHPSPNVYMSYIAYANMFYKQHFYKTYDLIVRELLVLYREIPEDDGYNTYPSLIEVPEYGQPKRTRWNSSLQVKQTLIWDLAVNPLNKQISGWSMLLRFFSEVDHTPFVKRDVSTRRCSVGLPSFERMREPFSVRLYTRRNTGRLVKRWR
jgi:hypothetical protein